MVRTTPLSLRLVTDPSPEEPSRDSGPSDEELVRGLRAGDTRIASAFYRRVRTPVMRTLRRLLRGNERDHEDLAQHAMVELISGIDRFRGDCPLEQWASRVAAHVAFKHLRRTQTERAVFSQVELVDVVASNVSSGKQPEREAALRSMAQRIRTHLEAMDQVKALTFVLHDVCGHDLKEVAEITGASVSAAQTRLVRGRRELHERIAEDAGLAGALIEMGAER